jgi:hypothetical protein
MLDGLRPQEESQSYIAQFPEWFNLSVSCRKHTDLGMCAQNMPLDFKKIHPLCVLTITSMTSPVKTQHFILLFSTTSFGLKGHNHFEHKIKRICTYTQSVWNLGFETSQFVLLCGYTGPVW